MSDKKYISGVLTTLDITGNNVVFFPKTRAKDVIYPNFSNVEDVTSNIETRLNNCCTHWIDGTNDGSVYLTTASTQKNIIGKSSIAGGTNACVYYGNDSIALGYESIVKANNSVAIGKWSHTNADNSGAFGINVKIHTLNSTALGQNIQIFSNNTTAVGKNINIIDDYPTSNSIILGSNIMYLTSLNSIIVGHDSSNLALNNSIAMVKSSKTIENDGTPAEVTSSALFGLNLRTNSNSIIMGTNDSLYGRGVMFGDRIKIIQNTNASSTSKCEIAIGVNIESNNSNTSTYIGTNINMKSSPYSTLIGRDIHISNCADNSFICGHNLNISNVSNSVMIGYNSNARFPVGIHSVNKSIILTSYSNIISNDSLVLTMNSELNTISSTVIGKNINAQNVTNSVLVGSNIEMESGSSSSIALGSDIQSSPKAIAIGKSIISTKSNSLAIGSSVEVTANDSIAIGTLSKSSTSNSLSIGYATNTSATNSIAIGTKSTATANYSLAIAGATVHGNGCTGIGIGAITGTDAENCLVLSSYESDVSSSHRASVNYGSSSIVIGDNISVNGNYIFALGHNTSIPKWNDNLSEYLIVSGNNISFTNHTNLEKQGYPKGSLIIGENIRSSTQYSITIGNNIWSQTNLNLNSSIYSGSIVIGEKMRTNTAISMVLGYNSNINAARSMIIGNNVSLGTGNSGPLRDSLIILNNANTDIQRSVYVGFNSNAIKNVEESICMVTNAYNYLDDSWYQPDRSNGRTILRSLVVSNRSRIDCRDSIAVGNAIELEHGIGCVTVGSNIGSPKTKEGPQSIGIVSIGRNLDKIINSGIMNYDNSISGTLMLGENIVTGIAEEPAGIYVGKNIYAQCWRGFTGFNASSSLMIGKDLSTYDISQSILIGNNASDANALICKSVSVRNMSSSIGIITDTNKSHNYGIGDMESSIAIINGTKNIISALDHSTILSYDTIFAGYKYRYSYNSTTNNIECKTIDLLTTEGQNESTIATINYSSIKCSECSFNAPVQHSLIYGSNIQLNGYSNTASMTQDALNHFTELKNNTIDYIDYYPDGSNTSIIIGSDVSGQCVSESLLIGSGMTFKQSHTSIILGKRIINGSIEQSIVTGNGTRVSGNMCNSILVGNDIYVNNNKTTNSNGDISIAAFGSQITASISDTSKVDHALVLVGKNSPTTLLDYEHVFAVADNNKWVLSASNDSIRGLTYSTTGSDYAEYMEWADGNLNNEDRCGRFVSLYTDGNQFSDVKIKVASGDDNEYIMGIVSGNPSFIGNADMIWTKQYETDKFGRIKYETDSEGNINPVINPNYDSSQEYILRSDRSEWDVIGLRGFVNTIDDGTCIVGCYVKPTIGGVATMSDTPTRFMCVARISTDVVKVDIR